MAPEQPKKLAGGAFGRYMQENRPGLLKECAGKPATASIKLGSERYKALDASSKSKYEKMYEQAKQQYEKDMAAFTAAGGEIQARKPNKDKKEKIAKDPNRPKKPVGGAFGCFQAKKRAELTKECAGKPVTAVLKLCAERWKALDAAAKLPYESDFKVKQAEYAKAMKDYVPPAGAADEEDGGDEEGDEDDEDGEAAEEEKVVPKKRKSDANDSATAAKKGKAMEVPVKKAMLGA